MDELDKIFSEGVSEESFQNDLEQYHIDSWSRPVKLIMWGIMLTTVTLNFLYLNYILPAFGMAFLYLGYRALREENSSFKAAYIVSTVRLVMQMVGFAIAATPLYAVNGNFVIALIKCVLQIAELVLFRSAVRKVYEKNGAERRGDPTAWLIVINVLIAALALSGINDLGVLGLILIVLYIIAITAIHKIWRAFNEEGFILKNASVKVNDRVFLPVYVGICLVLVLSLSAISGHLVPDSFEFTPYEHNVEIVTELTELSNMGFPGEILELLPAEDVKKLTEAQKVDRNLTFLDYGRTNKTDSLRAETIYVEVPDNKIYVIQYFEWYKGGAYWNDAFDIWMDNDSMNLNLESGALFYDKDGVTYKSKIPGLTFGSSTKNSLFFGPGTRNSVNGGVCYPFDAERQRGYVMYSYEYSEGRAIVCGSLDYYHMDSFFVYPYVAPVERIFSGVYDIWDREQNYTTYYTYGEFYDLMEKGQ